MIADDRAVKQHVHRILAKHCVDLAKLSLKAASGLVTLRGSLAREKGSEQRMGVLTPAIVGAMFWEIQHVSTVRRVHADFDNWVHAGGMWQPIHACGHAA